MNQSVNNSYSQVTGQYMQLIQQRIILYLRLLSLEENTVSALTEQILQRLKVELKPYAKKDWPNIALKVTLEELKNKGIAPEASYHPIFSEAFAPAPRRTPMGYKEFNPKNAVYKDTHCSSILIIRRFFFFTIILISTIIGTISIKTILSPNNISIIEWLIIAIFTFLFGWISMNFWTIVFGFFISLGKQNNLIKVPSTPQPITENLKVAMIMPVHNEAVPCIFAALRAMYDTIKEAGVLSHFDIYILSDSTSEAHNISEEIHWAKLCKDVAGFGKIFYRRRKLRIHKKSGNVSDFCRRWGWQYKYMITLDADSLMDGETLVRMVNTMESHPKVGILQTAPMAINQTSLIARLQQFASHLYGPLFFIGLRFWQLDESGFWGHNAIVRVEPFIKYCALPQFPGRPPFGGEILSHDFVEAALMRRAGWGVWLTHELKDSYEELPPNLLQELSRDKRWCQGNIQHLRLLFMPGIRLGHKILFLQGNFFYFSSLMWFLLLILMTINAIANFLQKPIYFTAEQSLFPAWTVEYLGLSYLLLSVTAIFLFTPKILSFILIVINPQKRGLFGGAWRLAVSIILETIFSTILAPLRMMFHSWYVLLNLTIPKLSWGSQSRLMKKTSFREAFRAHWPATAIALIWAGATYAINQTLFLWILAIVAPLILGIPISIIYSYSSIGLFFRKIRLFLVPTETAPPKVIKRYQQLLKNSV